VGWGWLDQGFERISELYNPLLKQLISTGKIRLRFPGPNLDSLDARAACLIGGALAKQVSLCLVLPDANPHRPAFLFAYALLEAWARLRSAGLTQQRTVLYCGVRPGIREQLSQVTISGLGVTLDGIFNQVHLSRGSGADHLTLGEHGLPRVVTAYGPTNAAELLERLDPAFVAIDLADAPKAAWLDELLASARRLKINVVGWSSNPLSEAVGKFTQHSRLVKFPMSRSYGGYCDFGSDEKSECLFQPYMTTAVRPLVITDDFTREYDTNLTAAIGCLKALGNGSRGSLAQSAIQLHWRLLRAVENLSVPLSFYEAEATHIWGLRPLAELAETCHHFQASVRKIDSEASLQLEAATTHLEQVLSFLSHKTPPLWSALTHLIHSEPRDGQARMIVFPSQARKELFSLALLSKLNVTADDLIPLRTWITTLPELQMFAENRDKLTSETSALSIPRSLDPVPTLVGLPTIGQTTRLLPFFFSEEAELLIHRYQRGWVRPSVRQWDDELSPNLDGILETVDLLSGRPRLPQVGLQVPHRISLAAPLAVRTDMKAAEDSSIDAKHALWDTPDLEREVGYLFEDDDEETVFSRDESEDQDGSESVLEPLTVDKAYELTFSAGWRGTFASEQRVNFVAPNTRKVEERYVRALRVGDAVLIIPSQPRQSLYALIISRVHQHPSIELHLALLRRWREDLQVGYQRWAKLHSDPIGSLLTELQRAGSLITSALALRFWLRGVTLCPGDAADVLRVAEILDLGFVQNHYRRISNAAARIRGLHRGLANRLNRWLNDQARGAGETHDAEIIDPALGLTFGDLRSSLIVTEIVSIRELEGLFLRATLGHIERVPTDDARRAIA
jgi:hypothetical protein